MTWWWGWDLVCTCPGRIKTRRVGLVVCPCVYMSIRSINGIILSLSSAEWMLLCTRFKMIIWPLASISSAMLVGRNELLHVTLSVSLCSLVINAAFLPSNHHPPSTHTHPDHSQPGVIQSVRRKCHHGTLVERKKVINTAPFPQLTPNLNFSHFFISHAFWHYFPIDASAAQNRGRGRTKKLWITHWWRMDSVMRATDETSSFCSTITMGLIWSLLCDTPRIYPSITALKATSCLRYLLRICPPRYCVNPSYLCSCVHNTKRYLYSFHWRMRENICLLILILVIPLSI